MREDEAAVRRNYNRQVGRARTVARAALAQYGLGGARVQLLAHRGNTLFRIDSPDGTRFVLRVYHGTGRPVAQIESELAWLAALRRDTDLYVPEPVAARDGAWVLNIPAPDGATPHHCVLFRWVEGRFIDRRLTSRHMTRVGAFLAGLHQHAAQWMPPPGFSRPHWTWGGLGAVAGDRGHQTAEEWAVFGAARERITAELATLEQQGAEYGLIHADFQQTNYLFHQGTVRAIDFDDCCWGYYAGDIAIPLFEMADRRRGPAMWEAFLEGYAQVRPLTPATRQQIRLFTAIRLIKRVNYRATVVDPTLRAGASYWRAYAVDWLGQWLEDEA